MTHDDLRPSQDPELRRLQQLARRGRSELDELEPDHAARLWDGVRRTVLADADGDAAASGGDSDAPTDPSRRAAPWLSLAVAAAVALVVGIGVGAGLDGGGDGPREAPPTLASIELDPLTDGVDARTATLHEGDAGRTIAVQLDGLPATDGFHEVWLLDPDTGALVSLGPTRPDGVYAVPDTVDLVELSVLDVSDEPRDGDPTHSGDSLLRGEVSWTG